MNTTRTKYLVAAALAGALASTIAYAQQVPLPERPADVPGPAAGTAMTKEYVQTIGRMAYVWGYALVNSHNRRSAFAYVTGQNGNVPGWNGGVLPMAPVGQSSMLDDYIKPDQTFVACPNQDVVYGIGCLALDLSPVVVQVPDFGDRFWVYQVVDLRTDGFAELGKMYGTAAGFYLLVGPDWDGDVPAGITGVFHSSTNTGIVIPRVFRDDTAEDLAAVQAPVSQIMMYPVDEFDGVMKSMDWTTLPHYPAAGDGAEEVRWVHPETFFEVLQTVLDDAPPLPGEEARYAEIRSVLAAAADDETVAAVLAEVAPEAETELIAPLFEFRNYGLPLAHFWTTQSNGAEFGTDYYTRTAVARSNIFVNKPVETKYFYQDLDSDGQRLDGAQTYTITFPAGGLPPVSGFWSLTLYNEHHFFHPNELNRYSLGTKSTHLQYNDDGSLTLHASATPPADDRRTNWLPAPTGPFSLYIRTYWADTAILDGTWQPPPVTKD